MLSKVFFLDIKWILMAVKTELLVNSSLLSRCFLNNTNISSKATLTTVLRILMMLPWVFIYVLIRWVTRCIDTVLLKYVKYVGLHITVYIWICEFGIILCTVISYLKINFNYHKNMALPCSYKRKLFLILLKI